MRIGIISAPMLFQRVGGLQVQILETMRALIETDGVEARYINVFEENLEDFDVIHVFGSMNGNHRIAETARSRWLPVVISAVLGAMFRARDRIICELIGRILGHVVGWHATTSYHQKGATLDNASHNIAWGNEERKALIRAYGQVPGRITVIPKA